MRIISRALGHTAHSIVGLDPAVRTVMRTVSGSATEVVAPQEGGSIILGEGETIAVEALPLRDDVSCASMGEEI